MSPRRPWRCPVPRSLVAGRRLGRRPSEPPDPSTLQIQRVLLATEGRPIPESAIRFAAGLKAPVRVLSIARVHGIKWAFPNPWLMPSRQEWAEQKAIVEQAVKALERQGLKANGHVIGTRKATKSILGEASRHGCDAIVMASDPPRNRFVADLLWSQEPYRVRRRARVPVYLVPAT
jgi:nucleotide-binding universal stress UspA family protein